MLSIAAHLTSFFAVEILVRVTNEAVFERVCVPAACLPDSSTFNREVYVVAPFVPPGGANQELFIVESPEVRLVYVGAVDLLLGDSLTFVDRFL